MNLIEKAKICKTCNNMKTLLSMSSNDDRGEILDYLINVSNVHGVDENNTLLMASNDDWLPVGVINTDGESSEIYGKRLGERVDLQDTDSTFLRTIDGRIIASGDNEYGQLLLNEVGNSIPAHRDIDLDYLEISSFDDVKRICPFYEGVLVLYNDGVCKKYVFDNEEDGLIIVNTFDDVKDISGNGVSEPTLLLIKNDNTLWGIGVNSDGQLGLGHNVNVMEEEFLGLSNVKEVYYADGTSIAVLKNGDVYSTGRNDNGQLGLGDYDDVNVFTKVNISNVKLISSCEWAILALCNDGKLYTWGNNESGQLGSGVQEFIASPTLINVDDVATILTANGISLLVTSENRIFATGYNDYGSLGVGDDDDIVYTFKELVHYDNLNVKKVYLTAAGTLALMKDSSLWSCGYNGLLSIGHVTEDDYISTLTATGITNVKHVISNGMSTFIIKEDGSTLVCGYNPNGELGLGHRDPIVSLTESNLLLKTPTPGYSITIA